MRKDDAMIPDNVRSCEYFQEQGKKKGKEAYEAVIGSRKFDNIMKNRLLSILKTRIQLLGGKVGKVLELMAGQGRNFPVLRAYFSEVEMLEQAKSLTDCFDKRIKKHVMRIQDFTWPIDEYECVIGVWCLAYLGNQDIENVLEKAIKAVRKGGHILLFEPILPVDGN